MKLAICNELFQDWALDDVIDYAAKTGYDAVEVAHFTFCDSVTDVTGAERARIRAHAEKAGAPIMGIHWVLVSPEGLHFTHPDPAIRARTTDYFHALIDFCADLGGRIITIGSPKNRNVVAPLTLEQATEHAVAVFSACCEHAEQRDVVLCIEPLGSNQTDFINRPDQAAALVRAVDHPHFRMMLDVYSMSCEQVDIPAAIREHAAMTAHFHANDDNRGFPGSGSVDYAPIVNALKEVGYQGCLSVEVFDFEPGPERIATESISFLQNLLQP